MSNQEFWGPYNGGVSITFDDGTANQLEKAVPMMNAAGLPATFYIKPSGEHWEQHQDEWRAVAAAGHEIGNHSFSHPCSGNLSGRNGLEDMTLADIEANILLAQTELDAVFPDKKEWTFAYPCYSTFVGRGIDRRSYVPVIAEHFVAGRCWGEYGFGNRPFSVDLSACWGMNCELMSGFEMVGLVEALTAKGQWVILTFHAIDGSQLSVTSHDFQMLLDYLVRRQNEILIAPVLEIAQKIRSASSF